MHSLSSAVKNLSGAVILGLILIVGLDCTGLNAAPIKAEIGILVQAAGMQQRASVRQKLHKGDQLQLHVKADLALYLYLIGFDGLQARLLKKSQVSSSELKLVPGKNKFMQVTGKTRRPRWLVVLSAATVPELEALANAPISSSSWFGLEKTLLRQGRPVLTDQGKNPTSIAANMRSTEIRIRRTYTGTDQMLVLQYKFRVLP